jgi:hypothetical protein
MNVYSRSAIPAFRHHATILTSPRLVSHKGTYYRSRSSDCIWLNHPDLLEYTMAQSDSKRNTSDKLNDLHSLLLSGICSLPSSLNVSGARGSVVG